MKLKIPPAIIFLFFGGFMYGLAYFLPVGGFDFFGKRYIIKVLLFVAIVIAIWSIAQFLISKTTIDPVTPSKVSKLVTGGLYKYSRNPMYLALLLILLGWCLWLGNAFNLILAALFVKYMNVFQIIPEEEILIQIFGKEYRQYCTKVRRWF